MAALDPVLSDLGRTAGVLLKIRADQWSDFPGQVAATIVEPDGTGTGVSVLMGDTSAERIVSVADQLQDVVVEALWKDARPATWPDCPEHANSHPLRAEHTDAGPTWVCPKSHTAFAAIGSLGTP